MVLGKQPDLIFEVSDFEGTQVVLTRETWYSKAGNEQVGKHPEIKDYLKEVRETVQSPDIVFQSTRNERSRIFYRLNAGRDEFTGKHIVVIVKYVSETAGERGYVTTFYLSRSIFSRGVRLWPKKKNSLQ